MYTKNVSSQSFISFAVNHQFDILSYAYVILIFFSLYLIDSVFGA